MCMWEFCVLGDGRREKSSLVDIYASAPPNSSMAHISIIVALRGEL